jgi:AraC-like DNA-binding protein
LYYNLSCGAQVKFAAKTSNLGPQHLLLIPPNTDVNLHLFKPCESLYLHFILGEPFDRLRNDIYEIPLEAIAGDALRSCLKQVKHETIQQPKPWLDLQVRTLIYSCMSLLPEKSWSFQLKDPRVDRLLAMMDSDIHIDNATLAREIQLTVNAMVRLFRENVGVPPQTYLRKLRLNHAAHLLTTTNENIEVISERCGFCDRHYFSKIFKTTFHCGPASYRKQSRGN